MKATTKEKETEKAAPERTGIHPEHKEQAERLLARGRQQGYVTQEDIVRAIPDAEPGKGLEAFAEKNELWEQRRDRALDFWSE